jgi:hypothetical protein
MITADQWLCTQTAPEWLRQFLAECRRAAQDDEVFKTFRQLPAIRAVTETKPVEFVSRDSTEIVRLLAGRFQEFAERLGPSCQRLDSIGSPNLVMWTASYADAPTTIYQLRQYALVRWLFPEDPAGWNVAEIGAGYGQFASIFCSQHPTARYAIFDVPEVAMLQQRVLAEMECTNVRWSSEIEDGSFDLVISDCALSEMNRETREEYIQKMLVPSRRGLIVWNDSCRGADPMLLNPAYAWGYLGELFYPKRIHWGRISPAYRQVFEHEVCHYYWGAQPDAA